MKNRFLKIALVGCAISIFILLYEITTTIAFFIDLNNDKMKYYAGYHVQKLILNEPNFKELQLTAVEGKLSRLGQELITWLVFTLILYLFYKESTQKRLVNACDCRMNIMGSNDFYCSRTEINFIVVFLTTVLFTAYGNAFMRLLGKDFDTVASKFMFYLLMFTVILPFIIALLYNLFRIFGDKLIYAFYITFYIKATAEFFTQEEIDKTEFSRVNIQDYSQEVRNYLNERHLESKVFQEKVKTDSINAALVGWGKHEHIEIYGNHGNFTDREFEAVLMHEIGHSQDYSLHKKVLALYIIKGCEFALILWLWKTASKEEENEVFSRTGIFLVFLIIYEMYLNKYFMVFHKLTSQNAEINADIIAKKHGFGTDLGYVLFKITVDAKEPIDYTFLYNAFKSFHPTIVRRVEYLNK